MPKRSMPLQLQVSLGLLVPDAELPLTVTAIGLRSE
jgi:hypothetical protein